MSKNSQKTVFVALSGGVDSSVAALILKKKVFFVVGVHLKCYNIDGCGKRDAEDARRVAEQLKIPFYVFDLEKEYKERVVQYMVDGYRRGLTPNPDVRCNREIKFGLFLEKALALGADYVATGHYVRLLARQDSIYSTNKIFSLLTAVDKQKDQSYFLWTLTQEQLKHCLFPIGDYTKPQVRKLAERSGLLTAHKKDSQGICFLGRVTLTDFLKNYLPEKDGLILNTTGREIGRHRGACFYTIGQRKGLAVGGLRQAHYVSAKDTSANVVILAPAGEASLFKKEVTLGEINFISQQFLPQRSGIKVYARVRYRQPLAEAELVFDSAINPRFRLIFDRPQKFVAAGQSAVFYTKNKELIGGGVIV